MAEIVDSVQVPIVGNGGIRSKADATQMLNKTGCARVAVGQGAKGNPWIFEEILSDKPSIDLNQRVDTCKRHLELYVNWVGEKQATIQMRKHAAWYIKGFTGASALRGRLGEAVDIKSFHNLLAEVKNFNETAVDDSGIGESPLSAETTDSDSPAL